MLLKAIAVLGMVTGNVFTWLTSTNWGAFVTVSSFVVLGLAGIWFTILQKRAENRIRLEEMETNARIAREERLSVARIAQEKRESEARIARIAREDEALKGSATEQLAKMAAQVHEQNESLAAARVSLHKMNDKAQADEMRRLEEITLLKDELTAARQEVHQLRDQNRVLTEQVFAMRTQLARNTAVVEKAGETMGAMGAQVQANAEAIAKTQADKTGEPNVS